MKPKACKNGGGPVKLTTTGKQPLYVYEKFWKMYFGPVKWKVSCADWVKYLRGICLNLITLNIGYTYTVEIDGKGKLLT